MKKILGKVSLTGLCLAGGLLLAHQAQADTYTIQNGDSFYSISQQYGMDANELAANNGMTIYDLILPGQTLEVPGVDVQAAPVSEENVETATSATVSYTVQSGDSFSSIAASYGMDFYQLAANNGLSIYDNLQPGQILQVADTSETRNDTASSSYYIEGLTYEPGINYPVGQCTWGVQKLTGWAGDWWGNAADWARNAAREGYAVGTTPMVGAIAVWDDGGYGHVAYVTDVASETSIQVLEANYKGQEWIGNFRGWFNPQSSNAKLSYIYPY